MVQHFNSSQWETKDQYKSRKLMEIQREKDEQERKKNELEKKNNELLIMEQELIDSRKKQGCCTTCGEKIGFIKKLFSVSHCSKHKSN